MNAYSELVREAIAIRDNKKRIAKTFGRRAKKKENVKVDGDDEMEEEKGPLSAEELKAEEEAKAKFDKA